MGRKKNKKARTRPRGPTKPRKKKEPRHLDLPLEELRAILEKTKAGALNASDREKLTGAVDTLALLTRELEAKGASLARLRRLLQPQSEKTGHVLGEREGDQGAESAQEKNSDAEKNGTAPEEGTTRRKKKGHGRKPASDYTGAERKSVRHGSLAHRDRCPGCTAGKIYRQKEPELLVRVSGVSPLDATVWELDRLRCNSCGEVYTAEAPPGVGYEKYDASAAAMMALLKYGCGLPFNRIEKLGKNLGIPMPSSTQWDVLKRAAKLAEPAWQELVHCAAQGDILHIDDTWARVHELNTQLQVELEAGRSKRSGVFTSGVVSTQGERQIALFFTGARHAGENLQEVLRQRATGRAPPIQMGDASSRNTCGDFESLVAACLVHARRNFVNVVEAFPDEVQHVLEELGKVYACDAQAREQDLSEAERLRLHQEHSRPVMEALAAWLQEQFDSRSVEPNSSLGKAIKYMQKRWSALTLFLREEGAPLDNNICERALKTAILHRKNALFYKTENGAHVGDVFMSLIHTAELAGVGPFDYLVALQKNRKAVEAAPEAWLPWNYTDAVELRAG